MHFSRCMIDGLKKIYLSCFFYTRVLKVISFSSLPPYFCPRVLSMVLYLVYVGGNCPRPARRSVRSPTKRAVAEQFVSRSLTPRKFSISFLMVWIGLLGVFWLLVFAWLDYNLFLPFRKVLFFCFPLPLCLEVWCFSRVTIWSNCQGNLACFLRWYFLYGVQETIFDVL